MPPIHPPPHSASRSAEPPSEHRGCGRFKSGSPIPAPLASPRSAPARPRSSMQQTAPTPNSCTSWTPPRPISPNIWTRSRPDTASEARRPHHRRAPGRTRQTAPGAGDPVRPLRPTHLHGHRCVGDLNRARRPPDTRAGRTLREKRSAQAFLSHDRSDLLGKNTPRRASLRTPRRRRHGGREPRARTVHGGRLLTATESSFRMIPRGSPTPEAPWRHPPTPPRRGLKNVAGDLGIAFKHHNALEDASATAQIVLHACAASETDIEHCLFVDHDGEGSHTPIRIFQQVETVLDRGQSVLSDHCSLPRSLASICHDVVVISVG